MGDAMMHAPSLRRYTLPALAAAALVLLGTYSSLYNSSFSYRSSTKGFHYVVPLTSPSHQACRALFSAAANGYPDPSLVGWQGRGTRNGTQGHLVKLTGPYEYLAALPSHREDDIIMVLDAFDVWLQLPPQVLLERYHKVIEKQNQRLQRENILGLRGVDGHEIKNNVLFGSDKICWPVDDDKGVHCHSVPESSLPEHIFGPNTDEDRSAFARPRFLNSGTMIGTVKAVRDMYKAAIDMMDEEWNPGFAKKTSDQYYISRVWARQEAARKQAATGSTEYTDSPYLAPRRAEYYMAIDHDNDVFQPDKWSEAYMAMMVFNRSNGADQITLFDPSRLDRLRLSQDVAALRTGPFSATGSNGSLPVHLSWNDVALGTNIATGTVFPLFHFTGNKDAMELLWPQMWFHPYGAGLLEARRRQRLSKTSSSLHAEEVIASVRGTKYSTVHADRGVQQQAQRARSSAHPRGGVWVDTGEYVPWETLCGAYDSQVFVQ